jgi:hypothetical protein
VTFVFDTSSALWWFAQSRNNQLSTTRRVTGKEHKAFDFKRFPTFFATFSFSFGLLSEISRDVDIKEVIETINRMQGDGVIDRYAIGGAIERLGYRESIYRDCRLAGSVSSLQRFFARRSVSPSRRERR